MTSLLRGTRHAMLLAVTAVALALPGIEAALSAAGGPWTPAPWPAYFLLWPPVAACWAWLLLDLPAPAYAEIATYFLMAGTGFVVEATRLPLAATVCLPALLVLPLVGVFHRQWRACLVGTALAVAFEVGWLVRMGPGTLGPAADLIGPAYALLFVALGTLDAVVARLLARRERELTESRRRAEEQERLYRLLAENSGDLILLHDAIGVVQYASPSCGLLLGYAPEELLGVTLLELVHPEDADALRGAFAEARGGNPARVACRLRARSRAYTWYEVHTRAVAGAEPSGQLQSTARDVSERVAYEQQLARQAFHDALTGLPNRILFHDRVAQALEHAGPALSLAVLFIDIDNFKRVNDSLGHAAGDGLLAGFAARLAGVVGARGTVARLGGDEFAVLLEGVRSQDEATSLAEAIERALEPPVTVGGRDLYVTVSIGIVVDAGDGAATDRLLRDADAAMYLAKSRGKAQHRLFDPRLADEALARLQLEGDLRRAVRDRNLVLLYQPIMSVSGLEVAGFEALVRWMHPRRGLLHPDAFIPVAEESGLIVPIGLWVLEEACHQAQRWQLRHGARRRFFMSVNVSPQQLQHPSFGEELDRILRRTGIDPATLQFEITEHVLLRDDPAVVDMLAAFRRRGIRIAIDDFGLGYSSLGYLKRFPVDALKIDRSFIMRVGEDPEDTAIVRTLVVLARELGMQVSGEGVENAEQWELLRRQRCDHAQGFYFAPPLPPEEAEAFLTAHPAPVVHPRRG